MKRINNSKPQWPECLVGMIDPHYKEEISDVKVCDNRCNIVGRTVCSRIMVIIPKVNGFTKEFCNIIPKESLE